MLGVRASLAATAGIMALLPAAAATTDWEASLGRLTASGGVEIEIDPGQWAPVGARVFPYAGERIDTGAGGQAVLTLPEGSVVFGASSIGRVARTETGPRILLDQDQGSLQVRVGQAATFSVQAVGLEVGPEQRGEAAGPLHAVFVLEEGRRLTVGCQGCALRVRGLEGEGERIVAAGAARTFAITTTPEASPTTPEASPAETPDVAAGQLSDVASDTTSALLSWIKPTAALSTVAVPAAAISVKGAEDTGDGDDEPQASPAN